jgi:hypothetical protein
VLWFPLYKKNSSRYAKWFFPVEKINKTIALMALAPSYPYQFYLPAKRKLTLTATSLGVLSDKT